MRIVVIGATGGTGAEVLQQAATRGHRVTAAVRSRGTLAEVDGVTVVDADVMDPASIAEVVAGHDAVISAIGSREKGPTTICTDSARAIVAGLGLAGVRRLVVVSASGFHTDGDHPIVRAVVKPVLGRMLAHQFADLRAMEQVVMASDTDWTVVRPPRLTNGAATGAYAAERGGNVRGSFSMSRSDLARALLDAAEDDTAVRAAIGVAA